ncbi:MAG: phospholipase domain-containing protein, partial [Massilia sp.]
AGEPLRILFDNHGTSNSAVFTVLDRITSSGVFSHTITVEAGSSALLPCIATDGWYDLQITLAGSSNFTQSMVGHVEGAAGVTRPALLRR